MGEIHPHGLVLPLVAAFSRYEAALDWGRARLAEMFGPVAQASPLFAFTETSYYEPSMGPELKKTFWVFGPHADPSELIAWKLRTNVLEENYARLGLHPEARPLNLDPGYLTLAKLVLASTKDHAHRIYLGQGIFAEVTLSYKSGQWQPHPWTFPDYRRADYHEFFNLCRRAFPKR